MSTCRVIRNPKGFPRVGPSWKKSSYIKRRNIPRKDIALCQGPTVFDLVPELFIELELDHSDLPSESLSIQPDIPVVDTDQMSPSEQQQEKLRLMCAQPRTFI